MLRDADSPATTPWRPVKELRSARGCTTGTLDARSDFDHARCMAKKAEGALLRGAKLIKKAIDVGRQEALAEPEPVAAAVLKKMTLPNGEPISAAMKELLKVDALWLGMEFDDEEGDIEAVTLDELIEDQFGKSAVPLFEEAIEMLAGDCIALGGASESVRFLYVGEADETGEYPVITLVKEPKPWVGGFLPFDVWVAQELGLLEAPSATPGAVPQAYVSAAEALATANGDGRIGFEPKAGEADPDEDEDDEDDDGDDEDSDGEDGDEEDAPPSDDDDDD
jgi:hypothetical protein